RFADEAERPVPDEGARQETRLAEDLEAVADPEHGPAGACVLRDRSHDRRAARHRAAAEVVTVGEAARQDDGVDAAEIAILVPERDRITTEDPLNHAERIPVVERAGERDDAPAHQRRSSSSSTRKSSMTPFASKRSHISRTRALAASRPASRSWSSMYFP